MSGTSRPDHEGFLRRALGLASRAALEQGSGGPFGAVIVREGAVIAEGMNRVVATGDPTWHAEMEAIRTAATGVVRHFKLTGCLLYASAEPCPMCLAAAYWAGIEAIYYASTRADARDIGGFDDARIYDEVALPPDRRAIPTRLVEPVRAEALALWEAYRRKPDRVPY